MGREYYIYVAEDFKTLWWEQAKEDQGLKHVGELKYFWKFVKNFIEGKQFTWLK